MSTAMALPSRDWLIRSLARGKGVFVVSPTFFIGEHSWLH